MSQSLACSKSLKSKPERLDAKYIAFKVIKDFTGGGVGGFALKYFTHKMVYAAIKDYTDDTKTRKDAWNQIRRALQKLGFTYSVNESGSSFKLRAP